MNTNAEAALSQLSARERVCLELCACGHTDKEVAARLGVTRHAIRFHIRNVMTKLSAKNRTHAVYISCLNGLLGNVE